MAAAAYLLLTAQTGIGQIPAWNLLGNPTGVQALSKGAPITTFLDGAFCSTSGSLLARGATTWGCVGQLPVTMIPQFGGDVINTTKHLNGGLNGLSTREWWTAQWKKELGAA